MGSRLAEHFKSIESIMYLLGLPAQRAAGCWVRATAAPPRPDTEAIPNAARFTEQIIADEKKCACPSPPPRFQTWLPQSLCFLPPTCVPC